MAFNMQHNNNIVFYFDLQRNAIKKVNGNGINSFISSLKLMQSEGMMENIFS